MSIDRRRVVLAAVATIAAPVVARGQTAMRDALDRPIRLGVLFSGSPMRWELIDRALVDGLRDHGYVEGKNITIVRRAATWPDDRMEGFARELAAMKLDVIYTSCGWTAAAAGKATSTTPIIFGKTSDPVARGLVKSLARPGSNLTGRTGRVPGLAPKMLELLHETLPEVKQVGVLMDPRFKALLERFREAESTAGALGIKLARIDYQSITKVDAAIATLRDSGVKALLALPDDDSMSEYLDQLHAVTVILRMPIFYPSRELVEFGGFMSYGPDSYEIYRAAVAYIDRVVKGANPAELPVEQPSRLELAINLRRANALGITIPRSALMRADYVVK